MAFKLYMGNDEGETTRQSTLKSQIQPPSNTTSSSTGFKSFEDMAGWANNELVKANAAGVKPDQSLLGNMTMEGYNNAVKDAIAKTSGTPQNAQPASQEVSTGKTQPTYVPMPTQVTNPVRDNSEQYKQMYAKQLDSTVAKIRQAIAAGKAKQQSIIQDAPAQFNPLKDQASFQGEKNLQNLREMMSNQGQNGGVNRTETTQVNTATENNINDINLQQQKVITDANRAIADLESQGAFDEAQAVADNANQMLAALIGESNRVDSENYSRLRDQIGDTRYGNEQAYSQYRDNVGDQRYEDQQAYSKLRDQVGDTRYADEQTYNRNRDTIGDQRYAAEQTYNQSRDTIGDQRYQSEQDYAKGRDIVSDQRYTQEYKDKQAGQKLQDQLTNEEITARRLDNEIAKAKSKYAPQLAQAQYDEARFDAEYARARAQGYNEEKAATIAVKKAQEANYRNESANRTKKTGYDTKKPYYNPNTTKKTTTTKPWYLQ